MKKITDLDNYIGADGDNPDGRLKDDIYLAGDPPILDEPGSEAIADTVMDLLTVAYRLVRENGETASGVADTQTASQIYDGLINKIKTVIQGPIFWGDFRIEIVEGSGMGKGLKIYDVFGKYVLINKRGITFFPGFGTPMFLDTGIEIDISSVTWATGSNGLYYSTAMAINTGIAWSSYPEHSANISLRFDDGGTRLKIVCPANVFLVESGGYAIINAVYVWSILSPSLSGMSAQKLFLKFSGRAV